MSLTCLTDYIGLRGCSVTTPRSGIYIDQLPGVELQLLEKISNEQQANFSGVFADIQERAQRRLQNDVVTQFKKRYRLKTITQSFDMGRDVDITSITGTGTNYRGWALEFNRVDQDFVDSNLQVHYIQTVDLYFTSTNATTIVIYDLVTGELLDSTAVAAPSAIGWQTIDIDFNTTRKRIFIAFDTTLLTSVEFDIQKLHNTTGGSSGCFGCGENCVAEIRGANATIAAPTALTFGNNAFGLGGVVSTKCSFDDFVCNNLDCFTTAYWYALGAELMWERQYSPRLNEFTAFDRIKAKELKQLFEVRYNGGTIDDIVYEGALNQAIDSIELDQADCCIECNNAVRFMETTP